MYEFLFVMGVLVGEAGLIGFILTRTTNDPSSSRANYLLFDAISFQILMVFFLLGIGEEKTGITTMGSMTGIGLLLGYLMLLQYVMNPETYIPDKPEISVTDIVYSILIVFVSVLPIELLNIQFQWWSEPSSPKSLLPLFSIFWNLLFATFPWNALNISHFIFWLSMSLATPLSFSLKGQVEKSLIASQSSSRLRGKEREVAQVLVPPIRIILTIFFFLIGSFLK